MEGKDDAPSRDISLRRTTIAASLLIAGIVGGGLLGRIAVGGELRAGPTGAPDFASLSSNPDALVADPVPTLPPCYACADSYGVAARMRAMREQDDQAYRALGTVDYDAPPPEEPTDDYRYGGRFPGVQTQNASLPEKPVEAVEAVEPAASPPAPDEAIATLVSNPAPQ